MGWLLLLAGVGVANRSAAGSFTNDLSLSGTDSQAAYQALREDFPEISGHLRVGDAGRAVADGVTATARVITAAASVVIVVFASFLLNDQRVVNLFGFGLAVAIAIDATLVRLVLVPAVMAVAGHRAWWVPRWLKRRVPPPRSIAGPAEPRRCGRPA